jgi:hypothetical protein
MVVRSDAIVHARITGIAPTRGVKLGCSADAFTYTATVVDGIKARSEDVDRSTIRWVQDSDAAGPRNGAEYLVFLAWDASNSRYSAGAGLYVFPVTRGQIEWHRHDARQRDRAIGHRDVHVVEDAEIRVAPDGARGLFAQCRVCGLRERRSRQQHDRREKNRPNCSKPHGALLQSTGREAHWLKQQDGCQPAYPSYPVVRSRT